MKNTPTAEKRCFSPTDLTKGENVVEFCRWFLCFVIFSCIGWFYESVYYTIQQRRPVNSGFLNGCICPIYGIGGLTVLIFLGDIENPIVLFLSGMVLTCALEYFVSWLLERLFHKRWWDYTGWPFNINGRVCIIGAVVFGIMAVAEVKFIAPTVFGMLKNLPDLYAKASAVLIALIILFDILVTVKNSDKFTGKLWYVREQAKIFEEGGIGMRMISAVNRRLPHREDKDSQRQSVTERIKRFLHMD